MAQTQQPDDEGARASGPAGEAPYPPGAGNDSAATTALPPYVGGPHTPGRGTAAPLGTVGDGRYRLTHRLGRGGMAEVFAAQDIRLGRTVAVKLLRGELAQDDIARLRFTREAHAVAALNHHSIVAVYDTGEEYVGDESTPYIVMELVEGRTVRELLVDEEAPPVDQALIIIAGVLEALAYSHRHGIVHRDIKPANVIITTTGAVKVMDFGIARALTGTASTMTQTGMVMGTPQYLSPEQALGKPVDHRSDLYAAGCMLYELLTLRPPFTGDTPLSVVYQHVQDMPVPPSQANPRVPAGLDPLVLRSLAKNPDDRFQDADEFRAHLQHALREMHGAGGAWAAGAAAAGLAAAGQGHSGATPVIGTDETAVLGAGSAVPGDQTTMLPYHPPGGPHTPASPYPGVGGPYNGGGEGPGDGGDGDGDGHGRRRGPWAWLAGAAAVLVASGVGIALALSGNGGGGGHNPTPTPSAPVSVVTSPEATTPTTGSTSTTAPTSQSSSRRPQQPTDNGNNQSPAASQPTGKHTQTPTMPATGTKTPTSTMSATGTPTGGATSSPTGGGGATGTPTTGTGGGATGTGAPPTKPGIPTSGATPPIGGGN
ncbi:protein kinase [Streptomyces sp. CB01881]|uniref:protein kinase domain-containing protein n=1 Tax=Streptomyces sp. CB01881 TaxID=2078691 RepID=UPI000CDBEDCD|nr:protein kinase [Streptomyces sp. CB01881]AUY50789.1 serine/threonine protein kinase [Streptomyces sp. CB01881]TYC74173.1 serine/threonine protein kinase [Streptomyces sp. CB01881]